MGPLGAACVRDREASGLKPLEPPPTEVGVKTGFEETGGEGPLDKAAGVLSPEYLDPDASATFRTMPSGERSLSDLAVTCTW